MISVQEALGIVLSNLPEPRDEEIPFQLALRHVLAEDLRARYDVPRFDRSAMDGFAVLSDDVRQVPAELDFGGEIRAGGGVPKVLNPGEAIAIMTGAPVPVGADAVQMVEHTRRSSDGGKVTILKPVRARENIASRGSEALEGEVVLEPGRHIGPAEIAVMATFGYTKVRVWKRPNVAILSTGDELVEVDQEPRPDQIRNSNAYCLASELKLMDLEVENLGIVRDKRDDLRQKMILGLEKDVMIITGGVSMGEYDLVEGIFRELGLEILFSKVAIKPGKPTVFARKKNKLVFGLPGNPVSALVTFEYFVRPALCRLCGMARPQLPIIKGELLADLRQSAPGRTAFLPARVSWEGEVWKIQPIPLMSSADVVGFSRANATVMFPCDSSSLSRGEIVQSMLLPDFFVR